MTGRMSLADAADSEYEWVLMEKAGGSGDRNGDGDDGSAYH
jgi:hypothetical protein